MRNVLWSNTNLYGVFSGQHVAILKTFVHWRYLSNCVTKSKVLCLFLDKIRLHAFRDFMAMHNKYLFAAAELKILFEHYNDVTMSLLASQITCLTIVYSTVYLRADQRKHQNSASLVVVWGIHRWPVTRKMFPFDDVIILNTRKRGTFYDTFTQ